MSFGNLLRKTGEVYRRDGDRDDYNQQNETFSYKSTVALALQAALSQSQRVSLGVDDLKQHIAYFQHDADVLLNDRIVVEGTNYRVSSVNDAAGRGHHKEAILIKEL